LARESERGVRPVARDLRLYPETLRGWVVGVQRGKTRRATDFTYIRTWQSWAHLVIVLDVYSRMVVGWQASRSLRSDLALDALEQAIWARCQAGQKLKELVHHSDRGVQGGFEWSSQHLVMGVVRDGCWRASRGDSDDAWAGVVAGSAVGGAAGGSAVVLASVRGWALERGRGCRGGGVAGGCSRWFRDSGGMPSISLRPLSGRYLSFSEREEIAILNARDHGV